MRPRLAHTVLSPAALLLLLTGCSSPGEKPPERAAAPAPAQGVLFVTIDTLRADHVGVTKGGVALTPAIDALARDGVTFTDALANCTVTRCSHASMLTGVYPRRHGIPGNHGVLARDVPTVGERLQQAKVATGAVISSTALRRFARGFDRFEKAFDSVEIHRSRQKTASPEATTRAAVDWLKEHRGERFFLFVHYLPPHGPYTPPSDFHVPALEAPSGERLPQSSRNYERGAIPAYQRLGDARDPALYRARYAANVRFVDHHVGGLLQALRDLGLYDRTAVLLTSDHGESLGERGWYFCHGNLTYREQSAVPLVLRLPQAARAGAQSAWPVQGVDVAPTILDLLGVPVPEGLDGQSVLARLASPRDPDRVRFTQSTDAEEMSVVAGAFKLTLLAREAQLVEKGHPARELYRLDRDPDEAKNLIAESETVAASLEALLVPQSDQKPPPIDAESQEQLRAMGYVR